MQKKIAKVEPGLIEIAPSQGFAADRHPDGDPREILEAIFRRERGNLVGYLGRRVGPELAADITQEVFLRAATSAQLPNLGNPRGFLRRIASNILIDRARRQRCRIVTLPLFENMDVRCAPAQDHELEANDLKASLENALSRLPERTRRIFVMHRFDDMAYREIRHELGISLATVEYHMMKALSHIRVALAEHS